MSTELTPEVLKEPVTLQSEEQSECPPPVPKKARAPRKKKSPAQEEPQTTPVSSAVSDVVNDLPVSNTPCPTETSQQDGNTTVSPVSSIECGQEDCVKDVEIDQNTVLVEKPKRKLSEKQKEALAAGRQKKKEEQLAQLKALKEEAESEFLQKLDERWEAKLDHLIKKLKPPKVVIQNVRKSRVSEEKPNLKKKSTSSSKTSLQKSPTPPYCNSTSSGWSSSSEESESSVELGTRIQKPIKAVTPPQRKRPKLFDKIFG